MALAHTIEGTGPAPVVLLHGFLGSRKNLGSLARSLAARAPKLRFVLLDLPGHGESPPLESDADLAALGREVLDTAAALGLATPLEIAGHSLGGRVALAASLERPGALSRITLLDIAPNPIDATRARDDAAVLDALVQAPPAAATRAEMREHLVAHGVPPALGDWLLMNLVRQGDGYVWRFDREALAALRAGTEATDLWSAVERPSGGERFRCIRGGRSPWVSPGDIERLEAAGCPVRTIEGAGHWVHVDRPAELVEALLAP